MINIPVNRLSTDLGTIRKVYWKGLLNSFLPKALKLDNNQGFNNIVTYSNGLWVVPTDTKWLRIQDNVDAESLVNNRYDDYTPRYYTREDHWALIVPTPVGNIIIHFESTSIPTETVEEQLSQPRYRIIVTVPHRLNGILSKSFSDIDSFMFTFFHSEGGTADDETVGRIIEQLIMANVNEVLLWILAATAAFVGIAHHVSSTVVN